jgi:hypothetical protein
MITHHMLSRKASCFIIRPLLKARQGKVLLAPTVRWLETGLRRMSSYELAGHVRSGGARGAASSIIVEHA